MSYNKMIFEIVKQKLGCDVTENEDLLENGKMDSLLFVEIIVEIEQKLEIQIPDENLNIIKFNSVKKMYNIIGDDYNE